MLVILSSIILSLTSRGQYYIRGSINDEKGKPLSNVKINLFSKGYIGLFSGSCGIPSSLRTDTITLEAEGFQVLKTAINTSQFQQFVLKCLPATQPPPMHLSSVTKNLLASGRYSFTPSNESYSRQIQNDFVSCSEFPETGFALNVDRASYSNVRRMIKSGSFVPPDAVRIEEMLNYFNFKLPEEEEEIVSNKGFSCKTQITSAPWSKTNQLLFVNLKAPKLDLSNLPPSNLVFLIDVSGSMDKPNRLPLIQSAFKLLVENLRPVDTLAIVVYGGDIGVKLAPTSGAEKKKINDAIDLLAPNGDTPGAGAIKAAYTEAAKSFNANGNNRVILATDGDFNVGESSEKALEELIIQQRQSGIYLTCLGLGMGNYKDSKLETLSKRGNGNFAYLDNMNEAEKVLIKEFTKTLYAVANDAFLHISFNPKMVSSYRLIGFDNRMEALNDSTSQLEGGEVGSGHSLIAIFEIIPVIKNVPAEGSDIIVAGRYGTIKLQYKLPGNSSARKQQFSVPANFIPFEQADPAIQQATAVAMFGELLKHSKFAAGYTWDDVRTIVTNVNRKSNSVLDKELLTLIDKAKKIYTSEKKRKKRNKD